jgi:hypothetical protein
MRTVKKLIIVVVAVVTIGALAVAIRIGSLSYRRATAVREYEARGFQMVEGCNGGAAVQADGQVLMLKQYLEDIAYPPVEDTNIVAQLQKALVVAQEKAQVLSEDCSRRGHCESHPWTTNWAVIKQALAAVEKPNQ